MEYFAAELKDFKAGASEMTFSGYGAFFNNVDSQGDVIIPGAFAETLAEIKASGVAPAMLLNHGGWATTATDMLPIGKWTNMYEDGSGLFVEGQLANTQTGRDAYELLKMKAISGLSIGYRVKLAENRTKPEDPKRKLIKLDLAEVSVVTFPSNPKARVDSVKSPLTIRDAERVLRDGGFSRTEAKTILSEGFKGLNPPRDAGGDDQTNTLAGIRRLITTLSTGTKNA